MSEKKIDYKLEEDFLLLNQTRETKDVFMYEIGSGGELDVEADGSVSIIFVDGEFSEAKFSFHGAYSRDEWRILAEINKRIEEIESIFGKEKENGS
ncbi:MAG: hypothetical protein KAS07_05555 [Candidatus Pacebacteria bacterium]|nr:hypothetical protein [Candidatus Paceibacterota bacterium]